MHDFNLDNAAADEFTNDELFAAADAREELGFLESEFDGEDESEFDDFGDEGQDWADGDHDSAMRDAGWGTDEDYGYYGDSDLGGEY